MPQTQTDEKKAGVIVEKEESLKNIPIPYDEGWIRIFMSTYALEALQQINEPSDEEKRQLEFLEKERLLMGFFCTRRLLEQLGKQVDSKKIIEILKTSGIEVSESQIEKWTRDYHESHGKYLDALKQKSKKTTKDTYKSPDGMKLTLIGNRDGSIEGHLEENLGLPDGRDKLENLIGRIRILSTIESIKRKVISGKKGEGEERLEVELTISNIEKFKGLEAERLEQIILYRNMQNMLQQRMNEIDKQREPFTQGTLDYIEHWTHLTIGKICHRSNVNTLEPGFYTIEQRNKARKKLLKIADCLRELYGLIEIKTKAEHEKDSRKNIVTREDILSDKKPHSTAKQRHIMMYIIKNKFSYLSSTAIGIIFGRIGKRKNHATVLLATATEDNENRKKQFVENVGLRPKSYKKTDNIERLYSDASEKYDAAHRD